MSLQINAFAWTNDCFDSLDKLFIVWGNPCLLYWPLEQLLTSVSLQPCPWWPSLIKSAFKFVDAYTQPSHEHWRLLTESPVWCRSYMVLSVQKLASEPFPHWSSPLQCVELPLDDLPNCGAAALPASNACWFPLGHFFCKWFLLPQMWHFSNRLQLREGSSTICSEVLTLLLFCRCFTDLWLEPRQS